MKNVPENELFSAYLDGEVTADEQAEIEELVATDHQAQQLLEELRALSTTLQSLPAQRVGVDLSEAVLRAAERRMLAESPAPVRRRERYSPDRVAWSDLFRRILRPRVILLSAVAAAVALMVVVATENRDRDQIAQGPGGERSPQSAAQPEIRSVEPEQPLGERPAESHQADKPATVAEAPAEGPAPAVPLADQTMRAAPSATEAPATTSVPQVSAPPASEQATTPPVPSTSPKPGEPSKPEPAAKKPADHEDRGEGPQVLVVRSEVPASLVREGRLLSILAEEQIIVQPPKDASGKVATPGPQHKLILIQGYATPSHVERAVARLKARPDTFSAVAVEALSGEAALAWTSPPARGLAGSATDAEASPAGPRRVRIGAVMSKPRPNVESQVHFDREPVKGDKEDSENASPAEPVAAVPDPKIAELPPSPSPGLRRVIFAFQVVESDKSASSDPAEKPSPARESAK